MTTRTHMPIMGFSLAVPMDVLSEDWAQRNHGQTLGQLAERGGLSLCEAAAVAHHRPYRHMTTMEALDAFAGLRRVRSAG